jgi:hypothetical protein
MKQIYLRLTHDMHALLCSIIEQELETMEEDVEEDQRLIDLAQAINAGAPDLDALTQEIHQLRNKLTAIQLQLQLQQRREEV